MGGEDEDDVGFPTKDEMREAPPDVIEKSDRPDGGDLGEEEEEE